MRTTLILALFASPAAGWEFSATPICTLTGPQTTVTYDASIPEYTLTVADRGFGNVLNGMEFNDRFTARLGTQAITIDLSDIAPAITDFRACPAPATS